MADMLCQTWGGEVNRRPGSPGPFSDETGNVRQTIRVAVQGMVHDLRIAHEGEGRIAGENDGLTSPDQGLLELVPTGDGLRVSARAEDRDQSVPFPGSVSGPQNRFEIAAQHRVPKEDDVVLDQ